MTKNCLTLGLIAAAAVAYAAVASAHSPCCEGKSCPAGQTAVAGATPADAQCCDDVTGACTSAPNAGWACSEVGADNPPGAPGPQGAGGCVQVEAANVCVGGSVTPAGPDGCVGLGLQFVAGTNPAASPEECTNAAVDACCAAGACVVAPDDGD